MRLAPQVKKRKKRKAWSGLGGFAGGKERCPPVALVGTFLQFSFCPPSLGGKGRKREGKKKKNFA